MGELLIRLFLMSVSECDEIASEPSGRKNPIWVDKHNFMSLLNVPEQMTLLGPVRNRCEGGTCGEGFLRCVKPTVQKGGMNWENNLLLNLLKKKAMT